MKHGLLIRKTTLVDAGQTSYIDVGSGDHVVALHGIPTSVFLFIPIMSFLTDYHFIAPDLLGQGETAIPRVGQLDHAACTNHLQSFIEVIAPS